MQFSLDKFFGINQQALKIHSQRSEILASNLANADTPGYQARDIDFKAALQRVNSEMNAGTVMTTNAKHFNGAGGMDNRINDLVGELKYRTPNQPSLDGNTVDPLLEKAAFMDSAMQYQTNLKFLGDKIKYIKSALKGE